MKVKDLIEKLKEYDENLDVLLCQREDWKFSNTKAVFYRTSFSFRDDEKDYDYLVISDTKEEDL